MPPLSPSPMSWPQSPSPWGDLAVPSSPASLEPSVALWSERRRPAPGEGAHPWAGSREGLLGTPEPPQEKRWPATHSQTSGAAVLPAAGSWMSGTKPHSWPWPWDSTTRRCRAAGWSCSGSPGETKKSVKNSPKMGFCGGVGQLQGPVHLPRALGVVLVKGNCETAIQQRAGDAKNWGGQKLGMSKKWGCPK